MKITSILLVSILLTACSKDKVYTTESNITFGEFSSGSMKAQPLYDQMIDGFGYEDIKLGMDFKDVIRILSNRKIEIVDIEENKIVFKHVTEENNVVGFLIVFGFIEKKLRARYLDFSETEWEYSH